MHPNHWILFVTQVHLMKYYATKLEAGQSETSIESLEKSLKFCEKTIKSSEAVYSRYHRYQ